MLPAAAKVFPVVAVQSERLVACAALQRWKPCPSKSNLAEGVVKQNGGPKGKAGRGAEGILGLSFEHPQQEQKDTMLRQSYVLNHFWDFRG